MEYWFLRDLDFLPEKLSERYPKLSRKVLKHKEHFALFKTKEEALEAANKVRELLGLYKVDSIGTRIS